MYDTSVPRESEGMYKGRHICDIRKRKAKAPRSLVKSLLHGRKADWRSAMQVKSE
jgi:hypothetical protein